MREKIERYLAKAWENWVRADDTCGYYDRMGEQNGPCHGEREAWGETIEMLTDLLKNCPE